MKWKAQIMLWLLGLALLTAGSSAGTTIELMGCRGVLNGTQAYCEGNCNRVCVRIQKDVYVGNPFPDDLQLYHDQQLTMQTECIFVGTSPDGSTAFVITP
ncbi:MAG: hypothetical protein RMK00_09425 [Bacteroidota bacterium]|nr:hypothetical protein [Bacteroidota bacterium]